MDVNVTPTANTPGVSTSNHGDYHGSHGYGNDGFHFSTYQVGKNGEEARDILRTILEQGKQIELAVERNAGDTRVSLERAISENRLAVAMVDKSIEIQALKTQAMVDVVRFEAGGKGVAFAQAIETQRQADQMADLKAKIAALTPACV